MNAGRRPEEIEIHTWNTQNCLPEWFEYMRKLNKDTSEGKWFLESGTAKRFALAVLNAGGSVSWIGSVSGTKSE
jgi:hypothetical protein